MSALETERFAGKVADLIAEAALLVGQLPERDPSARSRWTDDRSDWLRLYGGADFVEAAVGGPVATYLYEAGALLTTVADLLRTGQVTATLDPLVRGSVERAGRVTWLLDTAISADQRAARAMLERVACLAHYVAGENRIVQGDGSTEGHRAALVATVTQMKHWFDVVEPRKGRRSGPPSGWDVAKWKVGAERYPSLSSTARLAFNPTLDLGVALGIYANLSGFAHPNFVFSNDHFGSDDTGRPIFDYGTASISKIMRLSLVSFGAALTHFAGYFGLNQEHIHRRLTTMYDRLGVLWAEGCPPADPPGPTNSASRTD